MDRWRDEIRTFYRDTVDQIEKLLSDIDQEIYVEPPRMPRLTPWRDPREAETTNHAMPTSGRRDDDSSVDRLAILKRELAAKLSNSGRDDSTTGK
jgi:hypothetical protein